MNREDHLFRMIDDLRSVDEALGFREQLQAQGEYGGTVKVMLERRLAKLVGK